jgi:hypothetical protein
MKTVCAWCGTLLAEGDPGDPGTSHGICSVCSRIWSAGFPRCVVLPSNRSFLLPDVQRAFGEIRDLRVIVDRRRGERRRQRLQVSIERRDRRRDRRQSPGLIVGAIPRVGGFCLPMPAGQASALPPVLPDERNPRVSTNRRDATLPSFHPPFPPDRSR